MLVAGLPADVDASELTDDPYCDRRSGWVAVFGRFETKKAFERVKYPSGQTSDVGFGHLSGSPAQIVSPEGGRFCLVSRKDEFGPAGIDSARYLWMRIRQALKDDDGTAYFKTGMKDALIPGPVSGVSRLKGTVVSSEPVESPEILVLQMEKTSSPEVTLRFSMPFGRPVKSGTPVEFEGIAVQFSQAPFMVTFDVRSDQVVVGR